MGFKVFWRRVIALSAVGIGAIVSAAPAALAQNQYVGRAVEGQDVYVDLSSISRASSRSVDFVYYLGNKRINSQANCAAGSWITFPDKAVHRPLSAATAQMLQVVCNSTPTYSQPAPAATKTLVWFVSDPPSNVRDTPNGSVQCKVTSRQAINIYGFTSDKKWGITDFCGSRGYIHRTQLEPID